MSRTKHFYDPLYDFITFEEDNTDLLEFFAVDGGFTSKHSSIISSNFKAKLIIPFINTYEFKRLNFLRQSGFAFLVFPSATHNRYSHSIGCCNLGYLACQQISIEEHQDTRLLRRLSLLDWLDSPERLWREEFLIALLLHDIGHFPFSHTLESNSELWECFSKKLTHESLACTIILGKNNNPSSNPGSSIKYNDNIFQTHQNLYDVIRDIWNNKCKIDDFNLDCRFIADVIRENHKIDRNVLCYLISGEEYFRDQVPDERKIELDVLHALVSGLFDLDRIDHYRRDGFFTGLKLGSDLNYTSLLNGMKFVYWKERRNDTFHLCLTRQAIGDALTLLHSKERLSYDCFEDTRNIAYGVMLHRAVNLFLGVTEEEKQIFDNNQIRYSLELFLATDDELLHVLYACDNPEVKEIILRIKNQLPFDFITQIDIDASQYPTSMKVLKAEMIDFFNREGNEITSSDIFFMHSKNPKLKNYPNREWMNLEYLYDDSENGGNNLHNIKAYEAQIAYFQAKQNILTTKFWFFTPNRRKREKLLHLLSAYFAK